ncbi:Bifunctional phosphopantothenoylcysteine decarboxylase/phosphopantothenate synthase [Planctomycetales bacterium 10988]|nr:Bifunctional phosphopantothenoylcysteine decarboxylase/phosphopantothenate synthase [Planctomycetales bacterium 10988]
MTSPETPSDQRLDSQSPVAGRAILVGVSGGVAAYKAAQFVSKLAQQGANVSVVMTAAAEKFIQPATLAALSGKSVTHSLFDPRFPLGAHIELARQAELLCVTPATADILAKFAHGLADDLLSTLYLCATCPVVVAPAMNVEMWQKPAVQRNIAQLREDGVQIVGPEEGWLSCRTRGAGRLVEPEKLLLHVNELFASRPPSPN